MLVVFGLILWLIVLASPVRVWVDYRHLGLSEDALLVQSQLLWGAKTFTLQVPVIATGGQGVSLQAQAGKKVKKVKIKIPLTWSQLQEFKGMLQVARPIMKRQFQIIRKVLRIEGFVWHTELGLRDSARLAQLTGSTWGLKGMLLGLAQSFFRFKKRPIIRIRPRFNQSYFRTVFSCILVFPLGYIIIAAFFTGYLALKLKLAKKRGEKIVRTSNPRPNEDSHGKHQGNG